MSSLLRTRLIVVLAVLAASFLADAAAMAAAVDPLPTGTRFDYQLGGVRDVPSDVGIVVRDRTAPPLPGHYNICYVNGFQTQASQLRFWRRHDDLVLHRGGRPVVDSAWEEWLLDIGTAGKRHRLAAIVDRWTAGCARHGFEAVEFDNLDSFTRSHGLLRRADAVRYARALVRGAHRVGLAAGQKNLAGFDGRRVGYDFAIAEECGRYDECDAYRRHYGRAVLAVEYRRRDLAADCRRYGDQLNVVLRDRDLSADSVRRWCS
ncbi:endo alpha-1,4 polygalactosaminidase [Nocardioides nematodiphilus]|uniref:endo alpha-1,4 polygalactosaminidase n=1 Tax=Nocardioides nematodiphilus TaxID=2849669 RepID=UPI001CD92D1E|nr:endo alpha-1,4 polygalactosaminidase [Nocardioides nematodiphilus]MCA1981391.1 endo alpha-1,4 polygalactosaminidase [Nocardioides nematodiphilus]